MKNLFTRLMLVAVAAMGFVACQEGIDEVVVTTQNKVTVEFTGAFNDDTRSQFGEKDENGYPSTWSGNEAAYFSLNAADFVKATNNLDGSNASWSVEFTDDGLTTGTIYAFSPVNNNNTGGFKKIYANYEDVAVYVPSSQSPSTTSVAEPVHMLAATHNYTGGIPTAVGLEFEHILAYGKMQITGLSNVEISSVTVTSPIPFAGTNCYYYYATKTWDKADVDSITINNPETSNYTFWFGCVPVELNTGNLVVVVTATDGTTYTKTITLSETKHLNFTKGIVSSFSVNMSTEDVVVETPMQLIEDGNYVIAVSYDDSKYIMTASTENYQKHEDYIEPVDGIVTAPVENVWNIVYNGDGTYTIKSVSNDTYLSWSSGNSAKLTSTKGESTKMIITSHEEFFYIQSNKDNTRYLQFNSNSGQERFAFYTSAQKKTLLLIPAEVDTTPRFTVSPTDEQSIGAEGGDIQFTVTSYNGAVVTAVSDTTWLTIDDTFKATALANNSEKERKATITFKADDCEDVLVVITQAAKPAEVTGDWTLVTDASSLAVGDQIIIAASDYDYALSTTQNNNNRGAVAITKSETTVTFGDDVQILTLEAGTIAGTFAFYTGSGYLYAASSSNNYLRTQTDLSANSSWNITIAATGVATIIAQGTNTRNCMQYNSSSSLFACYSSASQKAIAIYKLTE